jgi:hypothetical protein
MGFRKVVTAPKGEYVRNLKNTTPKKQLPKIIAIGA